MRIMYAAVLAAMMQSWSFSGQGQHEIPVNMYTGTGSFQVPIWNVTSRDLSDPVSLVYSVKGVKLNERGGRFGVSWDINAGGSVTREVRGLPDDFKGTGNDRRRGWLYQKYNTTTYLSSSVAALPNTADNSASTCTDESSDYNAINGFGYDNDTEPDIYHFSAFGISGSFVFDNSATATPVVRLIPYQDIKIVPTFNPGASDPKITGFTITTNTGKVYTFNEVVTESRYTVKMISETTVEFLKSRYELYNKLGNHDNKEVVYNAEWKLSKVTSTTSDELTYAYSSEQVSTVDTVRAYIIRNANNTFYPVDVYADYRATTLKHLSTIYVEETTTTQRRVLELVASGGTVTAIKIYDFRRGSSDYVKQFDLTYQVTASKTFLKTVREASGSVLIPPYTFSYQLEYLPSKYSKGQDYWGYYNGKSNTHLAPKLYVYPGQLPGDRFRLEPLTGYTEGVGQYTMTGADRSVDTLAIQSGTLKRITLPSGGYTEIKYESNEYYDTVANQNFKGGGLRIKSLHYYDVLHPGSTIAKYFNYSDANGKSYGRLLSKPNFAVLTWEYRDPFSAVEQAPLLIDGDEWYNYNKIIVRFEEDISAPSFTQGSAVGYKQVRVSRPGSGYAIHEFELKGEFGATASGLWSATQNKFARTTGCPSVQWLTSGINGFPFAPNPDFEFERGLEKRKRDYNQGDTLVSETRTTYQYVYKAGSAPDYVSGVKFEKYPNSDATIFLFGKYFQITDVARVPASQQVITYDTKAPSRSMTQSSYYYYESAYHRLLSRTKNVLADGTIYQTYIKYPQDYPGTSIYWDDATECINTLKTTSRNGVPIETYQTITKVGDSEKVTGGSVVKFSDFAVTGKVLPQYTLSWNSATPILLSQFTPSWNDEIFYTDSRYETAGTVLSYSSEYDLPTSATGKSRVPGSTIFGYNTTTPVVAVSGALPAQFAFSDFETTTTAAFTETANPTLTYAGGRTGAKSLYFTQASLSKTLSKGAGTYVFTSWLKHNGGAITMNIKIQNSAGTVTYYNQNLTFTPATPANSFEYFEKEVPIDAALQTFKVVVTPVSGSCYMDDVAFYPAQASLSSQTYTFPFGANSATSGHHSNFIEFDTLGRMKYIKDKDGNILKKQTVILNNPIF